MRTIRTKVYQFNELNDDAKEVAINWYREKNRVDLGLFNEGAKEKIEDIGFLGNVELRYSLSNSQGDGLSFSCDYFDKLNELFIEVLGQGKEKTINCIINNCLFKLTGNTGHYCFASTSDIDYYLEDKEREYYRVTHIVRKVCKDLKGIYMKLCEDLEKDAYIDIEYQLSDDYIAEELIENEYEFTKSGKRFKFD